MEIVNFSQEAIVNRLLVQVFFVWRKWFKCLFASGCPIKLEPEFFFWGGTVCVTTYWACKVDYPKKEKNFQSTVPIWCPIIN